MSSRLFTLGVEGVCYPMDVKTKPVPTYRKLSVTSADGTTIGYRAFGSGPGVLLIHGGMQAAQNFTKLAEALASDFAVCVPDRRGRGASGPAGDGYGLATECADVEALLAATGARRVFGLSSGAIIALTAARTLSGIDKVAAYEPPLTTANADPAAWAARFHRELDQGDLAAAMATILVGTGDRDFLSYIPRSLLVRLFRLAIAKDAKDVHGDHVAIGTLIPTMRFDCRLQREGSASLDALGDVRAEVLLLGGDRSALSLVHALDDVARLLPAAKRKTLHGVGHIAADDNGRPADVAAVLRTFFATRAA